MATRSTDASEDPVDTTPGKTEPTKQDGADEAGEVEAEAEGKAPVHDASDTGRKAPTAMQAQNKAELAKVAQTLREDAAEGERTSISIERSRDRLPVVRIIRGAADVRILHVVQERAAVVHPPEV